MLVRGAGTHYRSSYQCLADPLLPLSGAVVLDVACGDGFLLSLLAGRSDASTVLSGVDLSVGELARARQRLHRSAHLCQGRAQALPFEPAVFTHVVCHMALMLMDDVGQVLREIRRVLVRDGIFAAVVGARTPVSPTMDAFAEALSRVARIPEFADVRFGDKRMRTTEGIHELLEGEFCDVSVQDLTATMNMTPTRLWEWLTDMYDLYLLTEVDRCAVRDEYLPALERMIDSDGLIRHEVCMRFFVARPNIAMEPTAPARS